ncbi:hypothetical protein AG1IA_09144 [Rhizoctonia solani AG-1 IA]|uniref:Uncharacterized protein n=1 Tax=Thanatephorus cucumeris (strain AG1-IA) TaxID=983506 RepID=L8WJ56_THACA|nr:hypothetical protein AG1IA_09144 [Rhizoctonia solani AG-1 IA]
MKSFVGGKRGVYYSSGVVRQVVKGGWCGPGTGLDAVVRDLRCIIYIVSNGLITCFTFANPSTLLRSSMCAPIYGQWPRDNSNIEKPDLCMRRKGSTGVR